MTKITKRTNSLISSLTTVAANEMGKFAIAETRFQETRDIDHKREYQKAQTKSDYVEALAVNTEPSAHNAMLGFISSAVYDDLISSSYSLEKVQWLSELLYSGDYSALSSASGTKAQLEVNLEFWIEQTTGAMVDASAYKSLVQKWEKSETQRQQTCKMLERMGMIEFHKDGRSIVGFTKTDHKMWTRLSEIHSATFVQAEIES
jgi:hypothetical protein